MAIESKLVKVEGLTTVAKDYNGKLDKKVDKLDGHGLYPDVDKAKLAGIEEGAQKNNITRVTVNDQEQTITEGLLAIDVETVIQGDGFVKRDELDQYAKNDEVDSKLEELQTEIEKTGNIKGETTKAEMGSLSPNPGDIYIVTDDDNHLYIYVGKNAVPGVDKFGFVQTKAELDTVVGSGTSDTATHDTNSFYVYFTEKPADVTNYSIQVQVDTKTYAIPCADAVGTIFGLGDPTDIKFVKEADAWAAHDSSEVDVTGKVVTLSVLKYTASASELATLSGESQVVIPPTVINCASSVAKGALGGVDENGFVDLHTHVDLSGYATTTYVDGELAKKADQSALDGYVKKDEIESTFDSYATDQEVSDLLQQYAKKDEIAKVQMKVVTQSELEGLKESSVEGDRVVVSDDSWHIYVYDGTDWHDTGTHIDLTDYQKTADADAKYALKTDLDSKANTADLADKLSEADLVFATEEEIQAALKAGETAAEPSS